MTRARYLAAMGLLVGCPSKENETAPSVTLPTATAPATASAPPSASAPAPTATGSGIPLNPGSGVGIDALKGVPSWTIETPRTPAPEWCNTVSESCFALADLARAIGASQATSCPSKIVVPCGCAPGAMCPNPNAPCGAPLDPKTTRAQGELKKAAACCFELPQHCVPPWAGRALDVQVGPLPEEKWARLARMEQTSVASFMRACLELLALGAPSDLVRGTLAAANDELRHALFAARGAPLGAVSEACSALAPPSFAHLAERTFLDACVPETVSAEILRREGLTEIAEDEARHAELAWRTLAWAVREGGEPARRALERALHVRMEDPTEDAIARDVALPCARALVASVRGPRRRA